MASAERKPLLGSEGLALSVVQMKSPWAGVRGDAGPPEVNEILHNSHAQVLGHAPFLNE
jgi:hypothetical protein